MKKLCLLLLVIGLSSVLNFSFAQQWGLYTLYAPMNGTTAYLIDTANTPVNYKTWTFTSSKKTGYSTYLIPGDTLLRTVARTGNQLTGGGITGEVQKVTWGGTVAWDYIYSSATYCLHHDVCYMPNGNVLMISYDVKSSAEATQAGASSATSGIWSEKIIEVKPTGTNTGNIVWEWKLWDHLCQNYNSAKDNYVSDGIVNHPQLMNINAGTGQDRYHMNGIDYNIALDQIVVSMHFTNEIYVIDHSTTTAQAATHTGGNSGMGGDFLFRWGKPANYGATGTAIFNVIHDAHWVPSDNPNYPNYLCAFNNKGGTNTNSAFTIWNPPYSGSTYSLTLGQPYLPSTYNYQYSYTTQAQDMGNSQQLPNGNVLMCIPGMGFGNIIELNAAGSTLWTISAVSPHAYRYSKCFVRGPQVTSSTSDNEICNGDAITLSSSASSVTETSPTYTYSWTSDVGGFSSSLQNPSASPSATTNYTVTITNTAIGCSNTASVTVIVDPCAGIEETSDNTNNLVVYPNPTTGILNLEGNELNSEIIIFDTFGKALIQVKNLNRIDMQELSNGIYYLKIKSENSSVVTKKIILIKK